MRRDQGDFLWDAFVIVMLAAGAVRSATLATATSPRCSLGKREIAHLEAPGVIDLRITRAGWSRVSAEYGDDPAVWRDPSRRDWIELRLRSVADLDRLSGLLTVAMAENA